MPSADVEARQRQRRVIIAWSDANVERVERFVADHIAEVGRGLTNAQMSGLINVVRSGQKADDVLKYVERQRTKAERQNRMSMEAFWHDLAAEFGKLKGEAAKLAGQASNEGGADLYYALVQEYVQHLSAQVVYQGGSR